MASSLRAAGVRGGERQTNDTKPGRTPRDAPLLAVHFARFVGVQDLERFLQARRVEQELQIIFAAGLEELDHFGVLFHGSDDLVRAERAAAVGIDHLKALARGVFELVGKFFDLLRGPRCIERALSRAVREFVLERDLDAFLPGRTNR